MKYIVTLRKGILILMFLCIFLPLYGCNLNQHTKTNVQDNIPNTITNKASDKVEMPKSQQIYKLEDFRFLKLGMLSSDIIKKLGDPNLINGNDKGINLNYNLEDGSYIKLSFYRPGESLTRAIIHHKDGAQEQFLPKEEKKK